MWCVVVTCECLNGYVSDEVTSTPSEKSRSPMACWTIELQLWMSNKNKDLLSYKFQFINKYLSLIIMKEGHKIYVSSR